MNLSRKLRQEQEIMREEDKHESRALAMQPIKTKVFSIKKDMNEN